VDLERGVNAAGDHLGVEAPRRSARHLAAEDERHPVGAPQHQAGRAGAPQTRRGPRPAPRTRLVPPLLALGRPWATIAGALGPAVVSQERDGPPEPARPCCIGLHDPRSGWPSFVWRSRPGTSRRSTTRPSAPRRSTSSSTRCSSRPGCSSGLTDRLPAFPEPPRLSRPRGLRRPGDAHRLGAGGRARDGVGAALLGLCCARLPTGWDLRAERPAPPVGVLGVEQLAAGVMWVPGLTLPHRGARRVRLPLARREPPPVGSASEGAARIPSLHRSRQLRESRPRRGDVLVEVEDVLGSYCRFDVLGSYCRFSARSRSYFSAP
jgi:hypothetical protein